MINIKEEFTKEIRNIKNLNEIEEKIKNISYTLTKEKLLKLKNRETIDQRVIELLKIYLKVIKDENIENINTISSVINGIIKAISEEKETLIYKKISQLSVIEREIEEEKNELKKIVENTYNNIENISDLLEQKSNKYLTSAINNTKLKDVVLLGILKETTEEAILTTIENKKNIEEIVKQIVKNIVYNAINEDNFSKTKILYISKTVLNVAISISDENIAEAKEILKGTAYGIKEATIEAINNFNKNIEFLPDEIKSKKEEEIFFEGLNIFDINEEYMDLLKNCAHNSKGVSKNILNDIILDLSGSVSKIIKITQNTKNNILKKIEKLKDSPKTNELKTKISQKFSDLKIEKKFKNIHKEDLEAIAKESKKLGLKAWESAKNALENAVNKKDK